jgi:hypothetical protein
LGKAGSHVGYATVNKATRKGNKLTVVLGCTASSDQKCKTNLSATRSKHTVKRSVTVKGGSSATFVLHLLGSARSTGSGLTTVLAKTGLFSATRTVH